MAKITIEELKETSNKYELRDPLIMYNMIKKINEIIRAIDGTSTNNETGRSMEASKK